MRAQLLLLVPQTRLFLAPHRPARKNHHNWLVPRLFAVRRATRCILVLLPFGRTKLLSSFASLLDRRHALLVVGLGLLSGTFDVVFGEESRVVVGGVGLALGFEGGEFAFGSGPAAGFGFFCCGFDTQLV
jgi:hypothetical protein